MRDSRRRQAGVEFLWMTIRLRKKNPVSILKCGNSSRERLSFFTSPLRSLSLPSWMSKLVREGHSWHPFPFLLPTLDEGTGPGRMSIDPPLQGLDYFDHFVLVCSLKWKVTCFLSPKHRDRFSGKINLRGFCFLFCHGPEKYW